MPEITAHAAAEPVEARDLSRRPIRRKPCTCDGSQAVTRDARLQRKTMRSAEDVSRRGGCRAAVPGRRPKRRVGCRLLLDVDDLHERPPWKDALYVNYVDMNLGADDLGIKQILTPRNAWSLASDVGADVSLAETEMLGTIGPSRWRANVFEPGAYGLTVRVAPSRKAKSTGLWRALFLGGAVDCFDS